MRFEDLKKGMKIICLSGYNSDITEGNIYTIGSTDSSDSSVSVRDDFGGVEWLYFNTYGRKWEVYDEASDATPHLDSNPKDNLAMIDFALETGDKEWFNELMARAGYTTVGQ